MTRQDERLRFRGGAIGALLPLLVFLAGALTLGLSGAPDERGFWPIVLLAMVVGLVLADSSNRYSESVIAGMSDEVVAVMVAAWLLSGVVGELVRQSGAVDYLVLGFVDLGVGPASFVCGAFVIAAIVGTSTGTAVGTVLIATPVLFPVGMGLGAGPYWVLGAILGGGAFGDDFSPLSDTTIASAKTQKVEIDASVRSRAKYALVAAALAVFALGGGQYLSLSIELPPAAVVEAQTVSVGLREGLMLLGPAIVIVLCFLRVHLLAALLWGSVFMVAFGLISGVFLASEIFRLDLENFSAQSIVIDGMSRGVGIAIFSILLIGLVRACLDSGVLEALLRKLQAVSGSGKSRAEVCIVILTVTVNAMLAHNTITLVAIGDFVKRLGEEAGIGGIRRANLIDLAGNTVMHILPYMITVLLASSVANSLTEEGTVLTWKAGLYNFHSWALLLIVLLTASTGIWRQRDEVRGQSGGGHGG